MATSRTCVETRNSRCAASSTPLLSPSVYVQIHLGAWHVASHGCQRTLDVVCHPPTRMGDPGRAGLLRKGNQSDHESDGDLHPAVGGEGGLQTQLAAAKRTGSGGKFSQDDTRSGLGGSFRSNRLG